MTQRVSRIFFLLIFTPWLSFGQNVAVVDTAAVEREVDSLLSFVRDNRDKPNTPGIFENAQKCIDLSLHFLGEENPKYRNAVYQYAVLNFRGGKLTESEALFLEMIKLLEKLNKAEDLEMANVYVFLGGVYRVKKEFQKSEYYMLKCKTIYSSLLEYESENFAGLLYSLGNLYITMNYYSKAEEYFKESLEIRKKILGSTSIDYALSLNGLALCYFSSGQYNAAEISFKESLEILEKNIGSDHIFIHTIKNNIGSIYYTTGQLEKSLKIYNEILISQERISMTNTPDYCRTLGNLSSTFQGLNNDVDAKKFRILGNQILFELFGEENLNFIENNIFLGGIYLKLQQIDSAEIIFSKARDLLIKLSLQESEVYASVLTGLGLCNMYKKNFPNAYICLSESAAIRERLFGVDHPDYLKYSIFNLVRINYISRDYDELLKNSSHFLNKTRINIFRTSLFQSELESRLYLTSYGSKFETIYSLCLGSNSYDISREIYNDLLYYKGMLLEDRLQIENEVIGYNKDFLEQYYFWKNLKRIYYEENLKPLADKNNTKELEEKINEIEKNIKFQIKKTHSEYNKFTWPEVRDRLSPAQAAIEFIHFRYYNPEPTDSTLYAALVLLPGDTAPHFIPLCEQRQLDAVIAGAQGDGGKIRIQDIYWPDTKSGSSLYSLIWAPLEPLLKGVKTVYFSPSGLLHRLNPGAIGKDKRTYLSDSIQFVQLGSTRQLVTGLNAGAQNVQTAVVFGGIHYAMDSTAIARANAGIPTDSTETKDSGMFKYADPAERTRGGDEKWDFLPETAAEADSILQILKGAGVETSKYDGYKATEESFKQIGKQQPSPRILHLATHGFFFPDPKDTSAARRSTLTDEPVFKISEHPMIRSGLMLAGSKYAWDTGQALEGMEDGILTAYEISQMNLSNTELVVLSACETGLGDIQGNEGVYGLQRAFKIAGVKNIVMSLWKVPEAATRELMTAFYKKWLDDKLSVRDALREAQQYVRAQPRYNSPYYWAGFVLVE